MSPRNGMLALRMELLQVGEALGWPRVPIREGKVVRAGEGNWNKLAQGPIQNVVPVLRNAKIRLANLGGGKDGEHVRMVAFDHVKYERGEKEPEPRRKKVAVVQLDED